MSSNNTTYYVYAYLRSKDSETAKAGTPYYIGKGKGDRYKKKHYVPIPKNSENIVFLKQNLIETEAHKEEIRLISEYGRKDLGTGILGNLTNGGEGTSGMVRTKESKLIQAKTMLGRTQTEDTIAKRAASLKGNTNGRYLAGIPKTKAHCANISAALKGVKKARIVCPHCSKDGQASNMKRYHFDKCKLVTIGDAATA